MGLFWNRKKKESAENEPAKSETPASGSGFLNRFLGREETEVKPTESAAATPAPVEVASELYTHTV
ncbi:MAG: hypothetical protein K1Y36_27910, partial [Blastocatellia bacterium]|nr:hypothetical protein [Blastocatellia bacterium]